MPENQPVYFLGHFTINDRDEYRKYEKGFFPLFGGTEGTFMALDDDGTVLEGSRPMGRTVLLNFPNKESVLDYWESDDYESIAKHRRAGTTTQAICLISGAEGSTAPEPCTDGKAVRFIAHFTIDDPEAYRVYEKGFFPILKEHGGRFVAYDDAPHMLEGERAEGRTVLIEFDSEDALTGWWESPEYRELVAHRHASTTTHCVFYMQMMRVVVED
ncbi:MAG: DUF1330 domain-containing protein [Actinomycetes bacterium]